MKILVADDEKELANVIRKILNMSLYDVDVVYNGRDALEGAIHNKYDVIILDVMMPEINGFDTVKMMRERYIDTPVLLLTAKAEIDEKVIGLDSGANDYLTKPFNKDELLARVRALDRNYKSLKVYEYEDMKFNSEKQEISSNKTTYKLNSKECEIMKMFFINKDNQISTTEILKNVWNNDNNIEIVRIYVSYLKNKIDALNCNVYINENNGYRMEKRNA
jgi:DNA-binding response OmpR family regulator